MPLPTLEQVHVFGNPVVAIPEPEGMSLPDVASATRLLDVRANALVLSDGDPVSPWANAGTLGGSFTQTGSARPLKQTIGGYPVVVFDGVDDWMGLGATESAALDNLDSFAVFFVGAADPITPSSVGDLVSKSGAPGDTPAANQWALYSWGGILYIQEGANGVQAGTYTDVSGGDMHVICGEVVSRSELHLYINGAIITDADDTWGEDGVSNYGNATPVVIGGDTYGLNNGIYRAVLGYQITDYTAWNAGDRAAITAMLAAENGITL
jgi:hypothetical protein